MVTMKTRLLIIFSFVGLSLLMPQIWGIDSEKEFSMKDYDDTLTIIEKQAKYVSPYKITNAIINDVNLSCDSGSLTVSILSNDAGTLQLEISKSMFGGIFMVLVDESEWDDVSIIGNTMTVNFPENTTRIEIFGTYYLSPDKHTGVCDAIHDPPHSYILSPLKQYESGIPFDEIQCKDGLELVGKMPSAHPKCVKFESVEKLTMRGWATTNKTIELTNPQKFVIDKNDQVFEVQYSLKGAVMETISHDVAANSVHIVLNNSVGGQMVISLPRGLIDAQIGQKSIDDVFFLLIDGEENMYGEKITQTHRTITIWFPNGIHDIEIIGTNWI